MARGTTLTRLLDELRAEARLSLNPAHNNQVRDQHIILLQREQQRLWEDYNWPHLRVERYIPMEQGQRTYDLVAAKNRAGETRNDLSFDRVEKVEFKTDGIWRPLGYGITGSHLTIYDSNLNATGWPVMYWERSEEDQVEVWPIPDQSGTTDQDSETYQEGYLKFTGIRNLNPLVADADRADLDDRLLVLYAAGNILAAETAPDAQIKLEAANKHYNRLKGVQVKSPSFQMFGIGECQPPRRPYITHYVRPE